MQVRIQFTILLHNVLPLSPIGTIATSAILAIAALLCDIEYLALVVGSLIHQLL